MNHRLSVALSGLFLSSCLPIGTTNQIAVSASAEIEVQPDSFRILATIRSRADNQDGVLSELSETLTRLTENFPQLEGLTSVTIEPSDLELHPVYNDECADAKNYNAEKTCPITGYFAEIGLQIEGSPATIAGNAFSLVIDLGAEEVEFDEYYLADSTEAERRAEAKAFELAKEKAQRLADSANVVLGGPVKISGGGTDRVFGAFGGLDEDTIIVTGSRIQARNLLAITPPPIMVESEISVIFEIE